ncbi:AMP-dependent synthetase [Rhizobium rhizosphaerae]|uniref:AMP-dependent synthetase n=1 Tax=Xaviernesmea rhizosphaerae TaxID=1672749 RepID=A0A1Q9AFM4_9HYPH|nr:AMP-binding protein [Xaviernesmea rhizosphaerae]OLP53721.1 AMP-dependent synthetase [Xaviernesmea rhizosphaerae]
MFAPHTDYRHLYDGFRWDLPERFNMGVAISDAWAARAPDRVCLEHFDPAGPLRTMTYGELSQASSALAKALRARGILPGDRVAILLPQGFEVAITHAAVYKLGGIALPLALLFGVEALAFRLKNAEARVVVTDRFGLSRLQEIRSSLPGLDCILVVGDAPPEGMLPFAALIRDAEGFSPLETGPDDPALMIYTSGTTGPPKGALHGHRVLLGHLPGFAFHHAPLPQPEDKLWTPADWAWAGGLLNALMPALTFGIPVVSSPAQKFDPHVALRILAECRVRNAFIPPTALRLMRAVDNPRDRYDIRLRTVSSAGESLGRDTQEQASAALGVPVAEFYGQTECNMVLSSSAHYGVMKPGSMGKPAPGHRVVILDADGAVAPPGTPGQVAVESPDPVMFLGYWRNPQATAAKFAGPYMTTGDQGVMDDEGYVTFFGRDDDVITSSGYRIGPAEIEDCLSGHPAVALAAVVGKPDPLRTEIVKAFIVLKPEVEGSEALKAELSAWVKTRLSMHEYPREVAFVDSLPLTTSGKVIRRALRESA